MGPNVCFWLQYKAISWRTWRCLGVFDGGPEDALLEIHFHTEVLAHLGGCVVALGGVYVEAEIAQSGEGLVLAAHDLVENVREDGEFVHEGEKPGSRALALSAKPLLLRLCR